jgi:hypothetical protein
MKLEISSASARDSTEWIPLSFLTHLFPVDTR